MNQREAFASNKGNKDGCNDNKEVLVIFALLSQRSGLQPTAEAGEEEVAGLVQESGMERSTIEELLRKYGFGSWTKPEEVWRGRDVARYSV